MALVSIVVPVYHNAASLADLLAAFQDLARRNDQDQFEFIFVDDGSGDNSFAVLEALAHQEPRLRVVKLARNFGSNAALLAGLDHARGDAVAAIAADLQDPPELIQDMLTCWRGGRKVVLAARQGRDDSLFTAWLAKRFYSLFRRFALPNMPPGGFDFFLIDRQVCNLIGNIQESNTYLMGLILWFGFAPAVIQYHRRGRAPKYGRSRWTLAKKLKYFVDSFVAFSYFPIRLATVTGLAVSFLGLLYAGYVILARLLFDIPTEGWASLMVVLLVVSGVQMLMTGILGEYLWRNLEETRRRPRYVVEKVVSAREATELKQSQPPSRAA